MPHFDFDIKCHKLLTQAHLFKNLVNAQTLYHPGGGKSSLDALILTDAALMVTSNRWQSIKDRVVQKQIKRAWPKLDKQSIDDFVGVRSYIKFIIALATMDAEILDVEHMEQSKGFTVHFNWNKKERYVVYLYDLDYYNRVPTVLTENGFDALFVSVKDLPYQKILQIGGKEQTVVISRQYLRRERSKLVSKIDVKQCFTDSGNDTDQYDTAGENVRGVGSDDGEDEDDDMNNGNASLVKAANVLRQKAMARRIIGRNKRSLHTLYIYAFNPA